MMTIFWDMKGVITMSFQETDQHVTSMTYCDLLKNRLRQDIRRKRPGLLTQGVILQHGNARPHIAQLTQETIRTLNWDTLPHPAFSPDLAPSDFHLFGPLKNTLKGHQFDHSQNLIKEARSWLRMQPQEFFEKGIRSLLRRWDKCISLRGDFVEV